MQTQKKILSVVGARPNFMKVAPLHKVFLQMPDKFIHKICHTGQHFDEKMSTIFFTELELPKPDFYLGISGGSHAEQTGKIMIAFEKVVLQENPDLIVVVGDVNSTLACALVASKLNIPIAHIEAGLRSFDNTMPEEINRKVTDILSDYLFVTEQSGITNLVNEGIDSGKMFLVGNSMIDSLFHYLPKTQDSKILQHLSIKAKEYTLVTFHRPSNVDDYNSLVKLHNFLNELAQLKTVVFPIHPRTKSNLESHNLLKSLSKNVVLSEPIGYIDFITLEKEALLVITDSGGVQVETTALHIPCLTLRNNTEIPATFEIGTNILVGTNFINVIQETKNILSDNYKKGSLPIFWDGNTATRIANILSEKLFS